MLQRNAIRPQPEPRPELGYFVQFELIYILVVKLLSFKVYLAKL
jgi:hypothetical protein